MTYTAGIRSAIAAFGQLRTPTGRPYADQSTDARGERRAVREGRLRRDQVPAAIWKLEDAAPAALDRPAPAVDPHPKED